MKLAFLAVVLFAASAFAQNVKPAPAIDPLDLKDGVVELSGTDIDTAIKPLLGKYTALFCQGTMPAAMGLEIAASPTGKHRPRVEIIDFIHTDMAKIGVIGDNYYAAVIKDKSDVVALTFSPDQPQWERLTLFSNGQTGDKFRLLGMAEWTTNDGSYHHAFMAALPGSFDRSVFLPAHNDYCSEKTKFEAFFKGDSH
jgi:hypothetical protein